MLLAPLMHEEGTPERTESGSKGIEPKMATDQNQICTSDSHEYFSVLVSDRHHLRFCFIDRTSRMGLLSAVVTRCTPARWCIQRIHRRRAPSCTSSCSRITDNLMSSSSGLRLLSLLSSFFPWPGARSRPRASSYLQWQRELHDLQWQRELFAVHSQVIARAAPVCP